MDSPFLGPTYSLQSRPASTQRTINLMPVPIEPGNERTSWVFKDVPGLVSFNSQTITQLVTWSTSFKAELTVLSSDLLTASDSPSAPPPFRHAIVAATYLMTTGKWYWENEVLAVDGLFPEGGLVPENTWTGSGPPFNGANDLLNQTGSVVVRCDGDALLGSGVVPDAFTPFVVGDIMMFAANLDDGLVWVGKNGVWYDDGDPATNTNPALGLAGGVSYYPSANAGANQSPGQIRANFGATAFAYPRPAGYSALTY